MMWIGYILVAYIMFVVAFGAEAKGRTFWERLGYLIGNFSWQFWVLCIITLLCLILAGG